MRYLYQLVNSIIAISCLVLIKIICRLELTSVQLFFIIPLGTFVTGMFASGGYPKGMVKDDIRPANKNLIPIFILSTITFIGIYFAYYAVTFVDANERVNFFFRGVHISQYKSVRVDINNFKEYIIDQINHMSFAPTKYYIRKYTGSVEGGKIFNWIVFAVQYLGYLFGSYAMWSITINSEVYCTECNTYMIKNKMFLFDGDLKKMMDTLIYYINSDKQSDFNKFISDNPYKKHSQQKRILKGTFFYCQSHTKGKLRIEYYNLKHRGYKIDNKATINYRLKDYHIDKLKKVLEDTNA